MNRRSDKKLTWKCARIKNRHRVFRSRFAIFDHPGGNVESVNKFRRYRWPLITTIINGLVIRSDMTRGYSDCTFLSAQLGVQLDPRRANKPRCKLTKARDSLLSVRFVRCCFHFFPPFVGNKLTEKGVWSNSLVDCLTWKLTLRWQLVL